MDVMEVDPHSLNAILKRIEQQVRCPQCTKNVTIGIPSVRMTGDDFILIQLQCSSCQAFIVLHATFKGPAGIFPKERQGVINVSSALCGKEQDVAALRNALKKAQGNLSTLFPERTSANEKRLS